MALHNPAMSCKKINSALLKGFTIKINFVKKIEITILKTIPCIVAT
jgi:hypothetical protein